MELLSLTHSPCGILEFSTNTTLQKSSYICGQPLRLPNCARHPRTRKLRFRHCTAQASAGGSIRESAQASNKILNSSCDDPVFVAGATGKVGSRTVRELLKLGFRVKAGVRSRERAKSLVESVEKLEIRSSASPNSTPAVKRLEIVECDLEKPSEIGPAISNSSVVICCIGASEKEVLDVTGPYRIDYQATKNLIDAATASKVKHFILVSSLGTNKVGFPAAILNLFWGVLIWKRKAEEALIASGIPYTIVRPGGMERPTDDYKLTHNMVLASADTYFGGLVSNLQIAELMAFMAENRGLSSNKVVEVIAETTAPQLPFEELLTKVPPDSPVNFVEEMKSESEPKTAPDVSVFETTTLSVETKPVEMKASKPLSPYHMYEGYKPPTSPTPTPSTTSTCPPERLEDISVPAQAEKAEANDTEGQEEAHTQLKKTKPLSPYFVYEDLKPPTSPSPNPPAAKKSMVEDIASLSASSSNQPREATVPTNDTLKSSEKSLHQAKSRPLSPYPVYEDLKPPTSPSPSVPNSLSSLSVSFSTQPHVAVDATNDAPKSLQDSNKTKPQALSPYSMYEDLKPPSSPMPSSPRKC
ncbi:protein TIC 62, chloroplastic [Nymphaea colorata]|nr:protein TIC 62, chloroplastic [Nymphaea colorata]